MNFHSSTLYYTTTTSNNSTNTNNDSDSDSNTVTTPTVALPVLDTRVPSVSFLSNNYPKILFLDALNTSKYLYYY